MTSPLIYILAVILLVLFCVMAWCHEREEAAHKVTQERLEAVLKDITEERQGWAGMINACWSREDSLAEANHAKANLIAHLKGEKANLLEIIKDRNETIQLHKDRDTHHAAQLQAARETSHAWFQHSGRYMAERDALKVRVGQQEQSLQSQAGIITTQTAHLQQYQTRNENQRLVIESLRATQVTLEEALAMHRNGDLVPRDLVTLAETIKAHLSAGLVGDAEVARLGAQLQRAVQVYRKASTSKTNAQELQDELKTPGGKTLAESRWA